MKVKASLFDLDGTLLNTLDDLADSSNAALARLHYPVHPVDSYRHFVGDGMRTLIERIVPKESSDEDILRCEEIFKEIYAKHWADKTCPYDGIAGMLSDLTGLGLKLAVLSNKPDEFTRMCVQRYFPAGCFACVRGQQDGVPKKPHPQGALLIAEELRLRPADILYVGDTATDMRTGKGAGMTTIGVSWGFREVGELELAGADIIVNNPQEIVRLCQ